MIQKAHLYLSLSQIDYIQGVLARHNRKYDWFLINEMDEQAGGKFGKNWTW